jgi:hypothetical protein
VTDTAVQQLREIREQWGDLLHAITVPPPAVWPPVQPSVQHLVRDDDAATGPQVGRLPLVLRQHPAPANLTALDAAVAIEQALFDLADVIAAAVQRPTRLRWTGIYTRTNGPLYAEEGADHGEPDRWHTATVRDIGRGQAASPGSRALGIHWCAVWLESRLLGDDGSARGDLFSPMPPVLIEEAAEVVAEAHRVLLAALGRDERAIPASEPCPWCHGTLTTRTTSGDPDDMTITCDTGPSCTAPTPYDDRARRTWHGRDQIAALMTAILHTKETAA